MIIAVVGFNHVLVLERPGCQSEEPDDCNGTVFAQEGVCLDPQQCEDGLELGEAGGRRTSEEATAIVQTKDGVGTDPRQGQRPEERTGLEACRMSC